LGVFFSDPGFLERPDGEGIKTLIFASPANLGVFSSALMEKGLRLSSSAHSPATTVFSSALMEKGLRRPDHGVWSAPLVFSSALMEKGLRLLQEYCFHDLLRFLERPDGEGIKTERARYTSIDPKFSRAP